MKPFETLYNIIHSIYCFSSEFRRKWPNPGQLVSRQSSADRENLKLLKSEDVLNVRDDDPYIKYGDENFQKNKDISNLKIKFDIKLKNERYL